MYQIQCIDDATEVTHIRFVLFIHGGDGTNKRVVTALNFLLLSVSNRTEACGKAGGDLKFGCRANDDKEGIHNFKSIHNLIITVITEILILVHVLQLV